MPYYCKEAEGTDLRLRRSQAPLSEDEIADARAGKLVYIPPSKRLLANPSDPGSIRERISAEDVELLGRVAPLTGS